jgi:hypothetical protein
VERHVTVDLVSAGDLAIAITEDPEVNPNVTSVVVNSQVTGRALAKIGADACGIPFRDMLAWYDVDRQVIAGNWTGSDSSLVDYSYNPNSFDLAADVAPSRNGYLGRYVIGFNAAAEFPARFHCESPALPYLHYGDHSIYLASGRGNDSFAFLFATTDQTAEGVGFGLLDADDMQFIVRNDLDSSEFPDDIVSAGTIPMGYEGGNMQVVSLLSSPTQATPADRLRAWVNGTGPTADNTFSGDAVASGTPPPLYVGSGPGGGSIGTGNFGELIIYAGLHTDAQRLVIEDYLIQKWRLGS